jgi:NitT/TauT family transport system substrate-binding protein
MRPIALFRCHHTAIAALPIALALFVPGCSSRTQEARRVRIATYTQGSLTALPLMLAERLGYFKAEHLAVTIDEMPSGTKAIEALLGGSADVASAFHELAVQMDMQGRDLNSFLALGRYPGYALVPSPAASKKITSIEDLRGTTVAVSSPGSPTDLFLKYVLSRHGVAANATSTVSAGSNMARMAMLERGSVGAAVLSDPVMTMFSRRHPDAPILADVRTAQGVREVYGTETYVCAVLMSRGSWLQSNPDLARRLARAVNHPQMDPYSFDRRDHQANAWTAEGIRSSSVCGSAACFSAQPS